MARWTPPHNDPIGSNEHIGRRLFDEPLLVGAADQPEFAGLSLRHFENSDREYSLDRLGLSSVDAAVVHYLRPRATEAGNRFRKPKSFNGWAVIRAARLTNPPKGKNVDLVPSPEHGEGLKENVFHAHALRPENQDDYSFALHLRHLFTSYGKVHKDS
jgi:hypothetical protein